MYFIVELLQTNSIFYNKYLVNYNILQDPRCIDVLQQLPTIVTGHTDGASLG